MIVGALAAIDQGPYSYSAKTDTTLYDFGGIKWVVTSYTAFNEDTGLEYFRLEHNLDANVKATDKVTFEIAFTMQNDNWTNKTQIAEDVSVCLMS